MKISKNQKPVSPSDPLHQRRSWQRDESRERDEQNSHSYWNLTCSKSQTTCKERDSPLSSANSYISNNASSPWALSRTSRCTDILWFFFFSIEKLFHLSHLFCASRLSTVCIVEDQQSVVLRRATHTVNKHILTHTRIRLQRKTRTLSFVRRFWSCLRGKIARNLPGYLVRELMPGHSHAH